MLDPFTPERNTRPHTAILSPYPEMADTRSMSRQFQARADLTQTTWLGMQRPGTNTLRFNQETQTLLGPEQYRDTIRRSLDTLRADIDDLGYEFTELIGHGESGGGVLVMALALEGLLNRIVIRDAINYRAPQHKIPGTFNFLGYLAIGERSKPNRPDAAQLPREPRAYGLKATVDIARAEIHHYSRLMRSTFGQEAARAMASNPWLPIRIVSLEHTFTGTPEVSANFAHDLLDIREKAELANRQVDPAFIAAEIQATTEPYYRSDLLDPELAARHIRETFNLRRAGRLEN